MAFSIKREATEIVLTDNELALAYFECLRRMQERDKHGDYKQWIADVYHCSGCWGQKQTDEEMLLELAESRRQADPEDYVPDIDLYQECAAYWNDLCDRYPGSDEEEDE